MIRGTWTGKITETIVARRRPPVGRNDGDRAGTTARRSSWRSPKHPR
ncbi:hypothetical protein I552_6861 [Mycobacterium xenopi 3993]|nr:hypothetical protein I552_6861 [Mycobacterium xenopi 3993]